MKKKSLLTILLVLLISSIFIVQGQDAQDIMGWRGSNWEMTKNEIFKLFKDDGIEYGSGLYPYYETREEFAKSLDMSNWTEEEVEIVWNQFDSSLIIKDFKISQYTFFVQFNMVENKDQLQAVHLTYKEIPEAYKRIHLKTAVDFFEISLTEKYGAPSQRTRNEEYDEKWSVLVREEYKVSWNFKSILIELYYNFEDSFAPTKASWAEKFKDLRVTPSVDDHKEGRGSLELRYQQVEKIIDKL